MIIGILVVIGLALGSFVNALVWRMHRSATSKQKLTVWSGRSMCTHCQTTLAAKDLLPVISWLVLRGRCRYCHKSIEDTPIAELLVPLLFITSYVFWPHSFDAAGIVLFVVWLLALVVLTALLVYDLRWMLLPNRLIVVFSVFAAVLLIVRAATEGVPVLLSGILAAVVIAGFFYVLHQVSNGKWIGGGDVKLGFGLGLVAGSPVGALMVVFLASLLGTLASLPKIIIDKSALVSRLPFGPFLILATVITFLFYQDVLSWYLGLLTL